MFELFHTYNLVLYIFQIFIQKNYCLETFRGFGRAQFYKYLFSETVKQSAECFVFSSSRFCISNIWLLIQDFNRLTLLTTCLPIEYMMMIQKTWLPLSILSYGLILTWTKKKTERRRMGLRYTGCLINVISYGEKIIIIIKEGCEITNSHNIPLSSKTSLAFSE